MRVAECVQKKCNTEIQKVTCETGHSEIVTKLMTRQLKHLKKLNSDLTVRAKSVATLKKTLRRKRIFRILQLPINEIARAYLQERIGAKQISKRIGLSHQWQVIRVLKLLGIYEPGSIEHQK